MQTALTLLEYTITAVAAVYGAGMMLSVFFIRPGHFIVKPADKTESEN